MKVHFAFLSHRVAAVLRRSAAVKLTHQRLVGFVDLAKLHIAHSVSVSAALAPLGGLVVGRSDFRFGGILRDTQNLVWSLLLFCHSCNDELMLATCNLLLATCCLLSLREVESLHFTPPGFFLPFFLLLEQARMVPCFDFQSWEVVVGEKPRRFAFMVLR